MVAVGGGGLFAGVAAAAAGRAEFVAVEPATIPTLHAALAHGAPVDVNVSGVAADALGARRIGEIAFDVAQQHPPRSVLVSDDDIVIRSGGAQGGSPPHETPDPILSGQNNRATEHHA